MFDVDIEDPFQQSGPADANRRREMGRVVLRMGSVLFDFLRVRNDFGTVFGAGLGTHVARRCINYAGHSALRANLRLFKIAPGDTEISKTQGNRNAEIVFAYASGAYSYREITDHFGVHLSTVGRIVRAGMK